MVDWHARYTQQARWTARVREYLFTQSGMNSTSKVLEVGCGTGTLLMELPSLTKAAIHGLDLSFENVRQTRTNVPAALLTCGDGHKLPYPDGCFDIIFCHFLLLWVESPAEVLREMKRVAKPGGAVLALAEPDYAGRIDHPSALEPLGRWQAESLRKQGADPDAGRKLRGWFCSAGIQPIESGIIAGGWSDAPYPDERKMEWEVIQADLAGQIPGHEIQKMKELDNAAWDRGERVLFVPTFYAWGRA